MAPLVILHPRPRRRSRRRRDRRLDAALAVALGAAFAALAVAAAHGECDPIDKAIRRRRGPTSDARRVLAATIKAVGQPWMQLTVAAGLTRRLRHRGVERSGALLLAVASAFVADRAFKKLVRRRRPPKYVGHTLTESFPSGHTTVAAAFSMTLARLLVRHGDIRAPHGTAAALFAAGGVAASRLELDEHWATDVVGGALLGAALSCAALAIAAD